jgi:hypothetical protein
MIGYLEGQDLQGNKYCTHQNFKIRKSKNPKIQKCKKAKKQKSYA